MNTEENEVSLLGLLLVVAENLKLLVLVPLLIGVIALGVGFALPQTFTSQAILALPTPTPTPTLVAMPSSAQAAAMMVSPLVLDPVALSLHMTAERSVDQARSSLAKDIKASVGKDGLLRLDVTARSPLDAQRLANTVIDAWLKTTVPTERERADLEKRLSYAEKSLAAVNGLLDSLASGGKSILDKQLTYGDAGTSMVAAGELQARYLADVLAIPRALDGLSRDVVVQSPSLPTDPVSPKKSLIAVLAALGSGFVLLLFVFTRQAWKSASKDPAAVQKQNQFLRALGLKNTGL